MVSASFEYDVKEGTAVCQSRIALREYQVCLLGSVIGSISITVVDCWIPTTVEPTFIMLDTAGALPGA